MSELRPHEIEEAIGNALTPEALEYWNGMSNDLTNQYIIEAQREGLDVAIAAVEEELKIIGSSMLTNCGRRLTPRGSWPQNPKPTR